MGIMDEPNKARDVFVSASVLAASSAIALAFVPWRLFMLSCAVLASHEAGHYYSASIRDGKPDLPIIAPLGAVNIGLTRVRQLPNLSKRAKRYIIASGPVTGMMGTVFLLPVVLMFSSPFLLAALSFYGAIELYNMLYGHDGKELRQARKPDGAA